MAVDASLPFKLLQLRTSLLGQAFDIQGRIPSSFRLVFDGAQLGIYLGELALEVPDLFECLWGRVGDRPTEAVHKVAAANARKLSEERFSFALDPEAFFTPPAFDLGDIGVADSLYSRKSCG